jgi:hypothetical protein
MRRRALLSTSATGLAATAGCLGPAFGFGTDCQRGADLRLRPTTDPQAADAASDPLDSLSPPERDVVTGGVGVTVWGVSRPFSGVEYLAADGTYYAVATTVESRVERPGYELNLDTADTENVPADRRVAFDDLRAIDRTALYSALGFPNPRDIERFERTNAISIGGTLAYPDDERQSRSALAPNPRYDVLTIGGRDFRLRLGERSPTTVTTYGVELTAVAESAEAFAVTILGRYGIDLDERDLSAEQRDIVETAIDDGYDECAPYSEAYADLQRTLGRQVTRVADDGDGDATTPAADAPERVDYANYGSEWYVVQLSEYVA